MRPRGGLAGVIAVAVVAAATGCAGGDDAAPIDTTVPTASIAATTTPPPPTTEPAPTTAEPAPTTTIDETAALIAEIEADLNEGEQALFAAGADPANPELRADLERYFSGPSLESAIATLDALVESGARVRPSLEVANVSKVWALQAVDDTSSPSAVTAEVCRVDAAVAYTRTSGGEAILNDEVISALSASRLDLTAGVWRLAGGDRIDRQPGSALCDG